jgi:hypothetical protein
VGDTGTLSFWLFLFLYSFVSKKSERGNSGIGQHGQRFNTGTCFSVSSDVKLVLFLFPGIPMGDPAMVTFYDVPPFTDKSCRDIHCIDKRGRK